MSKFRVIAIYLPQYHPFPENDQWWGKGFTEWSNVTKAKPLFPGHYQPHLPTDLGFYDLRVPEVREQQAQMAKEAGIYGFCYYHYWFNGKLLMERPLQEVLESGKPDFPFMICWANENWTRAWDGGEKQILIKQEYTIEDAKAHINWLIPYFKDPRYICIDNKPVIAIYRTPIIPNLEEMLAIWREEASKEGLELYICRFESFCDLGEDLLIPGIDAAIEFQPSGGCRLKYLKNNKIKHTLQKIIVKITKGRCPNFFNYSKYVDFYINYLFPNYKIYPSVCPSWDNSSRRKFGQIIFTGSTPKKYGEWLKSVIQRFKPYSKQENFIFINAWNEWAEGNHLEPDSKWKDAYLRETKEILDKYNN